MGIINTLKEKIAKAKSRVIAFEADGITYYVGDRVMIQHPPCKYGIKCVITEDTKRTRNAFRNLTSSHGDIIDAREIKICK